MTSPVIFLDGRVTVYLGDCREILATLDLGGIAVVSDPPYGIAYQHSGGGSAGIWDTNSQPKRRNAQMPLAGDGEPFDPTHLLKFENVLIWGADFSDVEFAWHSHNRAARIFSFKWKGIVGEKRGENNGKRDHPTQKPIALMRWSIDQTASGDRIIVDPYMGVGTTGVAAIQLGRDFVGVEIEPNYFDIACRRIEQALRESTPPLRLGDQVPA